MTTVIATWDGDYAQHDPYLVCQECNEKLCTVEEGDEFAVLVAVVADHVCGRDDNDHIGEEEPDDHSG